MYNFTKLEEEEIIFISDDTILKKENEELIISTMLTNKRLILFDYPLKSINYEEDLRISRGSYYILKKEPILIVDLLDLNKIIEEENFDKYMLNNNYFYLRDSLLKQNLKESLNITIS